MHFVAPFCTILHLPCQLSRKSQEILFFYCKFTLGMAQTVKQFTQSDSHLLTIKEAADFLRISRRSLFYLISSGRLQAVRLSPRMTRISLNELQRLTEVSFVASASSFPPFNNDKREKKKPDVSAKPETGNVNKRAKCRKTRSKCRAKFTSALHCKEE